MSDLMEMTWNNPMEVTWVNLMGKSLWFENECPYRFDLIDLSEKVPMFSWMNVPMRVTWNNPMRKSLWSIEGVPIKMTWMNPMRMSLSKWSDLIELKWIERFEVIWVNWRKWARTTLWESPYGQKKVSLWEWLDVSENESPYQNDQNRWDLN